MADKESMDNKNRQKIQNPLTDESNKKLAPHASLGKGKESVKRPDGKGNGICTLNNPG